MKLSQIKNELQKLNTIAFQLPNGELVPSHFHVTEVGKVTKHFIDCGGRNFYRSCDFSVIFP